MTTDQSKTQVVSQWRHSSNATELYFLLGFAIKETCWVEICGSVEWAVSDELWGVKLTTAPVLAYADFSILFILEVDGSYGGLGAVLFQKHEGKVRPIAYACRGYSSMNLESTFWEVNVWRSQISILLVTCLLQSLGPQNSIGLPSLLLLISVFIGLGKVTKCWCPFSTEPCI